MSKDVKGWRCSRERSGAAGETACTTSGFGKGDVLAKWVKKGERNSGEAVIVVAEPTPGISAAKRRRNVAWGVSPRVCDGKKVEAPAGAAEHGDYAVSVAPIGA